VDKSTGELVENDDLIAEGGKHYYATRPVEECENHVVYGKHDDIDSYMSRLRAVFIEKSREPRKIKGVRYESAVGTEAFFDEYEFSFSSKNIKKVEFFENCGDFFALESKKRLKFLDNFHKNLEISKSATFVLP
jgi:hypothetical protein